MGQSFADLPRNRRSAKPIAVRAEYLLAVCIVLFGAFTSVYTALLVHRSFSPVIDWDQWEVLNQVMQSRGHLTASQLWAQQNEHRIPFGRLACFADLVWFGGRNVSLLIENYFVQVFATLLFVFALKRLGNLSRVSFLSAIGFASFCFFSPSQTDNFIRGFQITFLLCLLAALTAFAAAVMHAQLTGVTGEKKWISGTLIAALLCALVAEFSLSSGLLVWPVLMLLGYGLRFPRRTQWVVAGVALGSIVLYFVNFRFPHPQASLTRNVSHLGELLTYIRVYFESTWSNKSLVLSWPTIWSIGRSGRKWPSFADFSTVTALLFSLCLAARFLLRRAENRYLSAFLIANILFTLAVATITGLGRLNFGLEQAASTRYQSVALIFWASFATLIIVGIDSRHCSAKLLTFQLTMLFLMLVAARRFDVYERISMDRKAALANAYESLIHDRANTGAYADLYPSPAMIPAWDNYLRSRGWGPRASDFREFSHYLWRTNPVKPYRVTGYHIAPETACVGFLDSAKALADPSNEVATTGWAWDCNRKNPPRSILIVLSTGDVVGEAHTGLPRPDVTQNLKDVTSPDTGWAIKIQVPEHASLQAFAVLDDTRSACPLASAYER